MGINNHQCFGKLLKVGEAKTNDKGYTQRAINFHIEDGDIEFIAKYRMDSKADGYNELDKLKGKFVGFYIQERGWDVNNIVKIFDLSKIKTA